MTSVIHCPYCRLGVSYHASQCGTTIGCPHCHRPFSIPLPVATTAPHLEASSVEPEPLAFDAAEPEDTGLRSRGNGQNKHVRELNESKGCIAIICPLIGAFIGVVFIGNDLADVRKDGAAVKAIGWGLGAFVGGLFGLIFHRIVWFGNDVPD